MQENETEYSAGVILDDIVPEDAMAFLEQISQAIDDSFCSKKSIESIEESGEQKSLNAVSGQKNLPPTDD